MSDNEWERTDVASVAELVEISSASDVVELISTAAESTATSTAASTAAAGHQTARMSTGGMAPGRRQFSTGGLAPRGRARALLPLPSDSEAGRDQTDGSTSSDPETAPAPAKVIKRTAHMSTGGKVPRPMRARMSPRPMRDQMSTGGKAPKKASLQRARMSRRPHDSDTDSDTDTTPLVD